MCSFEIYGTWASKQASQHTHAHAQCSPTKEATKIRKLAGRKTLVVEYITDNTFPYKCMLPKITSATYDNKNPFCLLRTPLKNGHLCYCLVPNAFT